MTKHRAPSPRLEKRAATRPPARTDHAFRQVGATKATNPATANVALLAIGFFAGMLGLKIFEKIEQRYEIRQTLSQTLPESAWMRVKALRASVYRQPHKKAMPVGTLYKNNRLEIAGRSADWVKIGPDRYMLLSDLEGIEREKKKF